MAGTEKDKENSASAPEVTEKYPDGGWGWVIVAATGISNFISIPVMQSFALLFKDRIEQLDMSTTDLTTIINVNAAFGMSLGLITGPLLKKLGYRKVALFGAVCLFIGITGTSWATTFIDFLVTYSLITSMGAFVLMSSFQLAVNTYFHERRSYASGMSTTLIGLGPVVMPHVITILLQHYDTTGTTMILGALSSHSILAALLLQPVKWHMKIEPVTPEEVEEMKQKTESSTEEPRRRKRNNTSQSMDHDVIDSYSLYGAETPLVSHRDFGSSQHISRRRKLSYQRSVSQNEDIRDNLILKHGVKSNSNSKSEDTIYLGSSIKIFDENLTYPFPQVDEDGRSREKVSYKNDESETKLINSNNQTNNTRKDSIQEENDEEKKSLLKRCFKSVVVFFDLDLLKDSGYIILMLGMSLAICAELNFSLFTPLILGDFGFSLQQIATTMSVIASADIVFRFLAPFIGGYLNYSAQKMYLLSLVMLIITRTSLMIFHDYTSALAVACGLGIAKGFRTVYMALVIPSYVPLSKLASASGIQSVVNCLLIVLSIPLMAAVRDETGSFYWCIAALNCITFVTVAMWTIQLTYETLKRQQKEDVSDNISVQSEQ